MLLKMEIRSLKTNDMESLSKLYRAFWDEESNVENMKQKLVQLQQNEAYILLGAIEDGQVAGSVMGIICDELYGECKPFLVLENMVVDERYRKKGVGKLLFQELERQAIDRDCRQIILVTEEERKDAAKFYEAMGFHPTKNKGFKKKLI